MAANELTFEQVASILNSIQHQATGQSAIAPTNTAAFVQCATTTLKTGPDTVMNAISAVLSKTIFSVRPYSAKFQGMRVSETAFGNHVRKLAMADTDVDDDDRYKWPMGYDAGQQPPDGEGKSVDQYVIKKPKVLQTNFYGSNVYSDHITVFRDQLEQAFTGPEQMGSFFSMIMQGMSDKLESYRENTSRALLANWIGGILAEGNADRVVHLVSEYNTLTGLSLTAQDVYKPANFKPFMQFVYARVASISDMMTERSQMFQTVVNNMAIMRHTPKADQRVYLFSPASHQTDMMAIADTYHDNYLTMADTERVNYWQSIETPDSISVTPSYIGTNGSVVTGSATEQAGIFGIIADREAFGYAETQQWMAPTPFNARGGYSNNWWHVTFKSWSDGTEKGVVLLLD